MEGALCPLQGLGTGSHGALGELGLGNAGEALEVVMAGIAEVGGTKAEVDSHRTAITALELQEVSPVLRTNLKFQIQVIMTYP